MRVSLLSIVIIALAAGTAVAQPIAEPEPEPEPDPVAEPDPQLDLDPEPEQLPIPPANHIADDPPPPPHDVADPPPPRPVPSSAMIAIASALVARMPEGASSMSDLGRGAALSIGWLQRRGDIPTGFAFRGLFLGGRESRVYGLDAQVIASAKLGRNAIAPFVGIGLAFGAVRFSDGNAKETASGIALGPAGSLGLHGFFGNTLYWRAELGASGAGGAVIDTGLSLGWVFGT